MNKLLQSKLFKTEQRLHKNSIIFFKISGLYFTSDLCALASLSHFLTSLSLSCLAVCSSDLLWDLLSASEEDEVIEDSTLRTGQVRNN